MGWNLPSSTPAASRTSTVSTAVGEMRVGGAPVVSRPVTVTVGALSPTSKVIGFTPGCSPVAVRVKRSAPTPRVMSALVTRRSADRRYRYVPSTARVTFANRTPRSLPAASLTRRFSVAGPVSGAPVMVSSARPETSSTTGSWTRSTTRVPGTRPVRVVTCSSFSPAPSAVALRIRIVTTAPSAPGGPSAAATTPPSPVNVAGSGFSNATSVVPRSQRTERNPSTIRGSSGRSATVTRTSTVGGSCATSRANVVRPVATGCSAVWYWPHRPRFVDTRAASAFSGSTTSVAYEPSAARVTGVGMITVEPPGNRAVVDSVSGPGAGTPRISTTPLTAIRVRPTSNESGSRLAPGWMSLSSALTRSGNGVSTVMLACTAATVAGSATRTR